MYGGLKSPARHDTRYEVPEWLHFETTKVVPAALSISGPPNGIWRLPVEGEGGDGGGAWHSRSVYGEY